MVKQKQLIELLKKKGTGTKMGKHLTTTELNTLDELFLSSDCKLSTKATLLIAILHLNKTDEEQEWIETAEQQLNIYPDACQLMFKLDNNSDLINAVKKIRQGQTLTENDIHICLKLVTQNEPPDYEKAAFLEALRLKEESMIENTSAYDFFWEQSQRIQSDLPIIIDLATPYDGFKKYPNLTPFIAALLGSIGLPTIIHGLERVAPKNGITVHQLLKTAGKNPLISLEQAHQNLKNPEIGWAYIDQSVFHPELHNLVPLREDMLKRSFIATVEKWMQPIRAKNGNHIITGFTHPPYRSKNKHILLHKQRCQDMLITRGAEGSPQLLLDRRSPVGDDDYVRPSDFGFKEIDRDLGDPTITAETCIEIGIDGLSGKHNETTTLLIYQALVIIRHCNFLSKNDALTQLNDSIYNKNALNSWNISH